MTTMLTMCIVHKWAPHEPMEVWVQLVAAKWTKPAKCHKPRSKSRFSKQVRRLSQSLLLPCKKDQRSPSPHPSPKFRLWTTGTRQITFVSWCVVLRSQRLRIVSLRSPHHPSLPTAKPTAGTRKRRKWWQVVIRHSISKELLSLITQTNSSRWRATCALFDSNYYFLSSVKEHGINLTITLNKNFKQI